MPAPALEIDRLRKAYRSRIVLDDLTLNAPAGAVTAVLGPNGAGKTTAVEICEGLRRADAGRVRVLGLDPGVRSQGAALRARVGVMLQDGGLPTAPTAGRFLAHVARLHADPLPLEPLVESLGLREALGTPVRRLSGGQRARVALAAALVGRPELAFLDEPTTGLDPQARHAVWDLVRGLRADGVSVVLTSHAMDEVEELADHVVVMDAGRAIAAGSPAELVGGGDRVGFVGPPALVLTDLAAALPDGLEVTETQAGHYQVRPRTPEAADLVDAAAVATVASWCAGRGIRPERLHLGRRSLEDVFLELTGRSLR